MIKKIKLLITVVLFIPAYIFTEDTKPFNPDLDLLPPITQKEFEMLEQNPEVDFVYMPDVIRELISDNKDSEKIDVNIVPRSLLLPELDKKIDQIKDDETLTVLRAYKKVVETGEAIITADEVADEHLPITRNWKGKNKTFCSLRVKNDLRVCGTICADCIKLGAFRISSTGLSFGTSTLNFDPATGRLVFNGDIQFNNVFVNGNANVTGNVKFCNNTLNAVGNSAISCLNLIRGTINLNPPAVIAGRAEGIASVSPISNNGTRVTFSTAYQNPPTVVATLEYLSVISDLSPSLPAGSIRVVNVTTTSFDLYLIDQSGGLVLEPMPDTFVNFVAIGVKP